MLVGSGACGKKKKKRFQRQDICTALCGGMRCELNCAALALLLAYADRRYALQRVATQGKVYDSESDVRTKGLGG